MPGQTSLTADSGFLLHLRYISSILAPAHYDTKPHYTPALAFSKLLLSPLGRRGASDLRLLAGAGGDFRCLAVEDYFRLLEIAAGVW
jgi:hypothetical protein